MHVPKVPAMVMSRVRFQASLSLPEFLQFYGTEENCEAALEQAHAGLMVSVAPAVSAWSAG